MALNTSTIERDAVEGPVEKPVGMPAVVWKAAYTMVGAMVLTFALGIGFFTVGGIFGPLSDAGSLLVGVLLVPVMWALFRVNHGVRFNRVAGTIGTAAIVAIGIGSLGLVLRSILSQIPDAAGGVFLGVQFAGWLLLGVWLLAVGAIGLAGDTVDRRVSWAALVAGIGTAGVILTLLYSYAVGSFTPAFPAFMVVFLLGFLAWAFLLGGELRTMSTRRSQ